LFSSGIIQIFAVRLEKAVNLDVMARVCDITGKKVQVGNNVSHANNRTRRKFYPNLQKKRFFIPEEDRWVSMRVSASGIRNINRLGVLGAIAKAKEKGTWSEA